MASAKVDQGKNDANQALDSATSGTSYLILIQLTSRILTFAGNQILLRFLTPNILGISMQLELYSVTVLYFSRESLRVALQRQPQYASAGVDKDPGKAKDSRSKQSQTVVNASYIAIAIGLPLAAVLGNAYGRNGSQEVLESPFFMLSLLLYGIATVIELLGEPAFVIIQQNSLYKSRAAAETAAACMKCFSACASAFAGNLLGMKLGVLPFAIGQLAYANVILFGYVASIYMSGQVDGFSLLLKPISKSTTYWFQRFSRPIVSLALSMYIQTGVKQLLSQADSVILVAVSSLEDQGAFALASNYGGLVARIIFQPIEESSRNAFGRLIGQDTANKDEKSKKGLRAALQHLTSVLHFYAIISIFAFCFAPNLLPLLVKFIVGPRWFSPEVSHLLSSYAIYIPFMAFNGIAEAFVSSVATTAELRNQSIWMGGFTMIFALTAYTFLRVLDLGASGLVYANAANMFLRTVWSWWFIKTYTDRRGVDLNIRTITPNTASIATGIAIAAYLGATSRGASGFLDFVIRIGVCGMGGIAIAFFERNFLLSYINHFLPQRLASKLGKFQS